MNPAGGERPGGVGVVLINWNSGEYTHACLASLSRSTRPADRILLVDNASHDGSPERLARDWPQVELLVQSENLGFAGGNNLAIRRLLDDPAIRFVWILNNDTEVRAECLEHMLTAFAADPGLGVVTGKMLYPAVGENTPTVWYAGGKIGWADFDSRHPGQGEPDGPRFASDADTDFVTGCSILVRRAVFEQLGGFDNQFFAYCEDADWSLRARAAGVRMRYVAKAVLTHHVSVSTRRNTLGDAGGRISPAVHFLLARNRRFLIRRHARGPRKFAACLVYALRQSWYGLGLRLRRRHKKLTAMRRGMAAGRSLAFRDPEPFEASSAFGMPRFDEPG